MGVGRATSLTRTVQRRDTPRRRNQNIVSAMSGSSVGSPHILASGTLLTVLRALLG